MFRFFSLLFLAVSVSAKPLNVVVLFADDWRYDTQGCAGNPVVKTPNLDAFEFLRTRPADKPFVLTLAFFCHSRPGPEPDAIPPAAREHEPLLEAEHAAKLPEMRSQFAVLKDAAK